MNVVIHAHKGQMRTTLENGQLAIEVEDEGPGISDIELALKEGYSTAPPAARTWVWRRHGASEYKKEFGQL